ncbi:hypothetical protein [Ammoniphilus sp. CFH 90114]|uniref:hypothetical protein n=1 Tax=Ammoniphilus sp. CFH 90114 TaxID=2493665 RepID=UPI00100FB4BE|nr:hypothetical protein [Ammoniphilus sp. CFH 90114]RXT03785.1 hypothetical protein EIZ39_22655 [Ammoniphilus sp. CFH 90114]
MLFVRTATTEDVEKMMSLDYRIYPKQWHIELEAVKQNFRRGTQLGRVVITEEGIKGYFAHLPLPRDAFEKVLRGELKEGDLANYVLHYDKEKEVYLYSVSFIVDIEDEHRKSYSRALIRDMPYFFGSLAEAGVIIKELGAIVISPDGKRLLESIGYHHDGQMLSYEGEEYPIYRAQVADIVDSINTFTRR